jgi:hypothetical protein
MLEIDSEPLAIVAAPIPASFRRLRRVMFRLSSAALQFAATPSSSTCWLLTFMYFAPGNARTAASVLNPPTIRALSRPIHDPYS